jgi:hypothetical protein
LKRRARPASKESPMNRCSLLPAALALPLVVAAFPGSATVKLPPPDQPLSFNRHVLAILSDRCYACHGPDSASRKAGLRLDRFDAATAELPENPGRYAIVPGQPERSEFVARLLTEDSSEVMPPPSSHKTLSAGEKEILIRWIREGARYETHWAYQPPRPPATPPGVHPVDALVRAKLAEQGLPPNPPADPATLLRRLSLDLTGLPPEPEEVEAFVRDPSPTHYARQVDHLLASPHYGEHLARYWLDAMRYADTHGYHFDNERSVWPYRDWVVQAFNDNLPFDRFTVEQLAGDLIPQATNSQLVASGCVRLHPTTNEGGIIDAEYRFKYTVDRVETLGMAWMGMTLGCASCHDHKYDPVTMEDFYSLYAFFNATSEPVRDGNAIDHRPVLRVPSRAQSEELTALATERAALQARMDGPQPEADAAQPAWEAAQQGLPPPRVDLGAWSVLGPFPPRDGAPLFTDFGPEREPHDAAKSYAPAGPWRPAEGLRDGAVFPLPDGLDTHYFHRVLTAEREGTVRVTFGSDDQLKVWVNGAIVHEAGASRGAAVGQDVVRIPLRAGRNDLLAKVVNRGGAGGFAFTFQADSVAGVADVPWFDDRQELGGQNGGTWKYVAADKGPVRSGKLSRVQEGAAEVQHYFSGAKQPLVLEEGDVWYAYVYLDPARPPEQVMLQWFGPSWNYRAYWGPPRLNYGQDKNKPDYDGHRHLGPLPETGRWVRLEVPASGVGIRPGTRITGMAFSQFGGRAHWDDAGLRRADPLSALRTLLAKPAAQRTPEEVARLREAYRQASWPEYSAWLARRAEIDRRRQELEAAFPVTLIAGELAKAPDTFVFSRGAYDQPDPARKVGRRVPEVLPPLPADAPRNRLGLAQWLVSADHPLTARVTVNRFWQQLFGIGLVKTTEDFGIQGERPLHQDVLDHLACRFRDTGWDVKELLRHLVLSETYRQSAAADPEAIARDPANRWLARGPRFRLDGEVIRDQALAVSGLLVRTLGGKPVRPYQPDGVWEAVAFEGSNTQRYKRDSGEALYRRSLYTFIKRTAPPPNLNAFDAPDREHAVVRRERTNTPMAALVLMNDPQFLEAARFLAQRSLFEAGSEPAARLSTMFRRVTARAPTPEESADLLAFAQAQFAHYQAHPADAQALLAIGETPADPALPPAELAAWTMTASVLLNLDEVVNKN